MVPPMYLSRSFALLSVMKVGLKISRNTSGKHLSSFFEAFPCYHLLLPSTPRMVYRRTESVLFSRTLLFHTMVKNCCDVLFHYFHPTRLFTSKDLPLLVMFQVVNSVTNLFQMINRSNYSMIHLEFHFLHGLTEWLFGTVLSLAQVFHARCQALLDQKILFLLKESFP